MHGTWRISALAAALLAGCGSGDTASMLIEGPNHALTVVRDKAFAWSDWEVSMVVARQQECMRRHKLRPVGEGAFKVEVFRTDTAFILRQGKNWYVTETQKCDLQQFKTPPPEPGELLGAFQVRDGGLKFVENPKAKTAPPAPAADTPTAPVR